MTGKIPFPSRAKYDSGIELSEKIRCQELKPQFPHHDYAGLLVDLAAELGQLPKSFNYFQENRIVTPFAFNSQWNEAMSRDLQEVHINSSKGNNISKFIVRSLENRKYSFQREIFNRLDNSSSFVNGNITFERIPSLSIDDKTIQDMCSTCAVSSSSASESEEKSPKSHLKEIETISEPDDRVFLLYRETGMIELPNKPGKPFEVNQYYIYYYNAKRDTLELFFTKRDNIMEIDYHFLSLRFQKQPGSGWIGRNEHLCIKDLYQATFLTQFNNFAIPNMSIEFEVQGPNKNYNSKTNLTLVE
jgi:hypothetical protein